MYCLGRKSIVAQIILAQLIITILLAGILLLKFGSAVALSALLGGFICIVPNLYMVYKLFIYTGARATKKIVSNFYKGEVGKLMITVLGFTMTFTLVESVNHLTVLLTYIVTQAAFWLTPLMTAKKN